MLMKKTEKLAKSWDFEVIFPKRQDAKTDMDNKVNTEPNWPRKAGVPCVPLRFVTGKKN